MFTRQASKYVFFRSVFKKVTRLWHFWNQKIDTHVPYGRIQHNNTTQHAALPNICKDKNVINVTAFNHPFILHALHQFSHILT